MDYGPAVNEPGLCASTHQVAAPLRLRRGSLSPRPPGDLSEARRGPQRCGLQRMTMTDDRQWLELARAGDRAAFGKLIRQHQQRVHRLALHLTGSVGEADDVTQETF